jgi:hypothetical protein
MMPLFAATLMPGITGDMVFGMLLALPIGIPFCIEARTGSRRQLTIRSPG